MGTFKHELDGFCSKYISLVEQKMDPTQLKGESQVENVSKGFPFWGQGKFLWSLQHAPAEFDRRPLKPLD